MEIQKRITRQRVNHIVDSYQLDGDDGDAFTDYLNQLLETYSQSLVELAVTESIIQGWAKIPMKKGIPLLRGVHKLLNSWQPKQSPPSQSSSSLKAQNSKALGTVTSLDVTAVHPTPVGPTSIAVTFTPTQFEQITGLDASLVFDAEGQVLIHQPTEPIKPLEQQ